MTKSTYKRSLAAIVFTDIVGYSSIMQQDEGHAKRLRNRHREVFDELTPHYNGKILQYYGDGTLSVFDSAVDAVECATKMQLAFQEEPQVPLRIGIHLGDIAFDDQEAFGDGMNIASRVERICSPKSIFMSYKVYDEIKNHSWIETKHLGAFNFKNIESAIDLYAVSNDGIYFPDQNYLTNLNFSQNKAFRSQSQYTLSKWMLAAVAVIALLALMMGGNYAYHLINPHDDIAQYEGDEKMSLAVLPFTNFNDDHESDYFSDGITEDILTLLSQIEGLDVVSRTSVMQYKNTTKTIGEIARELGANHILEGSVRKSGNKVRIVAQLIDAKKDTHIWADTYDEELTEIFEVQSQVAQNIATALKSKLSDHDKETLADRPTEDVGAYDLYLKGRSYYRKYTPEDNDEAIDLFEEALDIDENFALAYAGLGDALAQKANKKGSNGPLIDSAIAMSKKAISIKPGLSEGHKSLGLAYQFQGDEVKALDAYFTAMKYDSKNDMAASNISSIYLMRGDFIKSIEWSHRAYEINPSYGLSLLALASKYFVVDMDEETTFLCQKGIEQHPDYNEFHTTLANMDIRNQDYESAHLNADRALEIDPGDALAMAIHADAYFLNRNLSKAKEAYNEMLSFPKERIKENFTLESFAKGTLGYIDILEGNKKEGIKQIKNVIAGVTEMPKAYKKVTYYDRILCYLYTALGDDKKAIKFMKKTANNGLLDVGYIQANYLFDNIRKYPEVQDLLRKSSASQDNIRAEIRKLGKLSKTTFL